MRFTVVAHRESETNVALVEAARGLGVDAELLPPRDALRLLDWGDVALARLDVRDELDGIESGTPELERLTAGGVEVRSEVGVGSRFSIALPVPADRPSAAARYLGSGSSL